MLSRADAELTRRDHALPGLATLLDPDRIVEALRPALAGTGVRGARPTYTRYKPGTNCLVAYELEADSGDRVQVYAKAHGADAHSKLEKAVDRRGHEGVHGARLLLPEVGIVVAVFPNDNKLEVLPRLGDSSARRDLLSKIIAARPELWGGAVETLRYKPERRYVGRLVAGGAPAAVLRFYLEPEFESSSRNAKHLHSRGILRIAERIGTYNAHHALALEWLEGRPLRDALVGTEPCIPACAAVGAALAEIHGQKTKKLAIRSCESEVAALASAAALLGFLCPGLAKRAEALVERLAARLAARPARPRAVHGDFYDKQVLLDGDRVAILDLDRAACGDGIADLGSFVARLERDCVMEQFPAERVEAAEEALLDGYRQATGEPASEGVGTAVAAGLLLVASEPFRERRPDWPARAAILLERAEARAAGDSA